MTAEQKISACIKERGLMVKYVAEKSGVPYTRLQPTLKGHRRMQLDEFMAVCAVLDVNPADFRADAV